MFPYACRPARGQLIQTENVSTIPRVPTTGEEGHSDEGESLSDEEESLSNAESLSDKEEFLSDKESLSDEEVFLVIPGEGNGTLPEWGTA